MSTPQPEEINKGTFTYQNHHVCRLPAISVKGLAIRTYINSWFWTLKESLSEVSLSRAGYFGFHSCTESPKPKISSLDGQTCIQSRHAPHSERLFLTLVQQRLVCWGVVAHYLSDLALQAGRNHTKYYTLLWYTILYYTIYYTILYYTILYYTILYSTILYYTILYFFIFRPAPL